MVSLIYRNGLSVYETSSEEESRTSFGHMYEQKVLEILKKLGIREMPNIDEFRKLGHTLKKPLIFRTTVAQDRKGMGDIVAYLPREDKFYNLDLTVSRDPDVQASKHRHEEQGGPIHVPIPANIIDRAYKGSERDIVEVVECIEEAIDSYEHPEKYYNMGD